MDFEGTSEKTLFEGRFVDKSVAQTIIVTGEVPFLTSLSNEGMYFAVRLQCSDEVFPE